MFNYIIILIFLKPFKCSFLYKLYSEYDLILGTCFPGLNVMFETDLSGEILTEKMCDEMCLFCEFSRKVNLEYYSYSQNFLDNFIEGYYSIKYMEISPPQNPTKVVIDRVVYYDGDCNLAGKMVLIQKDAISVDDCYFDGKNHVRCYCGINSEVKCDYYNYSPDKQCSQSEFIETKNMQKCNPFYLNPDRTDNFNLVSNFVCNVNYPDNMLSIKMYLIRLIGVENEIKNGLESSFQGVGCVKNQVSEGTWRKIICSDESCEKNCFTVFSTTNGYYTFEFPSFFGKISSLGTLGQIIDNDYGKEIGIITSRDLRIFTYNSHRSEKKKQVSTTEYVKEVSQLINSNYCYKSKSVKHSCEIIREDDEKQEMLLLKYSENDLNCSGDHSEEYVMNNYQDWFCGISVETRNNSEVLILGIISIFVFFCILLYCGVGVFILFCVRKRQNLPKYQVLKNLTEIPNEDDDDFYIKSEFEKIENKKIVYQQKKTSKELNKNGEENFSLRKRKRKGKKSKKRKRSIGNSDDDDDEVTIDISDEDSDEEKTETIASDDSDDDDDDETTLENTETFESDDSDDETTLENTETIEKYDSSDDEEDISDEEDESDE